MGLERSYDEQMQIGNFLAQEPPGLRQVCHPLVADKAADEAGHYAAVRDPVPRRTSRRHRFADGRGIESAVGIHAVAATPEQDPELSRRAYLLLYSHGANRMADAEDPMSQEAGEPLGPPRADA